MSVLQISSCSLSRFVYFVSHKANLQKNISSSPKHSYFQSLSLIIQILQVLIPHFPLNTLLGHFFFSHHFILSNVFEQRSLYYSSPYFVLLVRLPYLSGVNNELFHCAHMWKLRNRSRFSPFFSFITLLKLTCLPETLVTLSLSLKKSLWLSKYPITILFTLFVKVILPDFASNKWSSSLFKFSALRYVFQSFWAHYSPYFILRQRKIIELTSFMRT